MLLGSSIQKLALAGVALLALAIPSVAEASGRYDRGERYSRGHYRGHSDRGHSRSSFSFGFGFNSGWHNRGHVGYRSYYPAPVYYRPSYIYRPAPVYCPPPVYYSPPVYYEPARVYYHEDHYVPRSGSSFEFRYRYRD